MILIVCGFGINREVLKNRIVDLENEKNILFINWGFGKYV